MDEDLSWGEEDLPEFYRAPEKEPAPAPAPVNPQVNDEPSDDVTWGDDDLPTFYRRAKAPPPAPEPVRKTFGERMQAMGADAGEALGIAQKGVGSLASSLGSASDYLNMPMWGPSETPDKERLSAKVKKWGDDFQKAGEARYSERLKGISKGGISDAWKNGNTIDYLALRTMESLPSTVASLAVGGGAGMLARGAAAGALAFSGATTTGAALGMGDTYQQIADGINKTPSATLAQNSSAYRDDIAAGKSEEQAKRELIEDAGWWQPMVVGAVTGLTSKFGLEEMLAKRAAGEFVTEGIINGGLKPFLKGAAGEMSQEFLESGAQELAAQDAAVRAGTQKGYDWGKIAAAAGEGAVIGGITGGALGPALQRTEGDKTEASKVPAEGAPAPADGLGQTQGTSTPGSTQAATPPPPSSPVEETVKEVAKAAPARPGVPGKVDPDQAVAIAPQPAAPPVEAGTDEDTEDLQSEEGDFDPDQEAALEQLLEGEPEEQGQIQPPTAIPAPAQPEPLGTPTSGARRAMQRPGKEGDQIDQIVQAVQAAIPAEPEEPMAAMTPAEPLPAEPVAPLPMEPAAPVAPEAAPPAAIIPEPVVASPEIDLEPDFSLPDEGDLGIDLSPDVLPEPVSPLTPAPVVAPSATQPKIQLKRRRELKPGALTREAPAQAAPEGKRPRSQGLRSALTPQVHAEVKSDLMTDYDTQTVEAAVAQAMNEYADEADSSQHASVGAAIKALHGPIATRAKAIARDMVTKAKQAKAVQEAKEQVTAQERAVGEAKRKLIKGTGQEVERTGKHKGKSAERTVEEHERSWERRYQGKEATDERTQRIQKLFERRAALQRDRSKFAQRERESIREQLQTLREEDYAKEREKLAAQKAAEPSEEEKAAKLEKETAELAIAKQRDEDEKEAAEEAARLAKVKERNEDHDRKLAATIAAHPSNVDTKGMTANESTEAIKQNTVSFIRDLIARIGKVPDTLSPNQSTAQNFLVAVKQALKGTKLADIKGDRMWDIVSLRMGAEIQSPADFYAGLEKSERDRKAVADEYEGDEKLDSTMGLGIGAETEEQRLRRTITGEESDAEEAERILEEEDRAAFRRNEGWESVGTDVEDFFAEEQAAQRSLTKQTGPVKTTDHSVKSYHGEVTVPEEDVEKLGDVLDLSGSPMRRGFLSKWRWASKTKGLVAVGDVGKITSPETAKQAATGLNTDSIYNLIRKTSDKAIRKVLGNVPVYWVTDAQMRTLTNEHNPRRNLNGFWAEPTQADRAMGAKGAIVLNTSLRESPELIAFVVRHEGMHGLTAYAIEENIDGMRDTLNLMLKEIKAQLDREGRSHVHNDSTHAEYQYGLSDADEMAAEAMSNAAFMEFLAETPVPSNVLRRLGDHKLVGRQAVSWWDLFVNKLAHLVRVSGFGQRGTTYLEGVLRMMEPSLREDNWVQQHALLQTTMYPTAENTQRQRSPIVLKQPGQKQFQFPAMHHLLPHEFGTKMLYHATVDAKETVDQMATLPGAGMRWRARFAKLKTITQLAQDTVPWLGRDNNPFFKMADAIRRRGVETKEQMVKGDQLVVRMQNLPVKAREKFADLVNLSTLHEFDPSEALHTGNNKHIKKGFRDQRRRAVYAKARAAFLSLPADAQALFRETGAFYRQMQNDMARQQLATMLAEARSSDALPQLPPGMTDKTLEDWIMDGGIDRIGTIREDPADKTKFAALGPLAQSFRDIGALRSIKGFYSPLMRRGDIVVRAKRKLKVPAGAQVWGKAKDQLAFAKKADFEAWAASDDSHQRINPYSVFVKRVGGKIQRVAHDEPGAKRIYIVSPQLDHMERFEKVKDANAAYKALKAHPDYENVTTPDLAKNFRDSAAEMDILPSTQKALIEGATKHIKDNATREQVRRSLANAIMQSNVGTRIQQRQRLRRGVHGYDKDVARAMADYNVSASNHITKLRARPEINAARREIENEIDQRKYATDGSHGVLSTNLRAIEQNLRTDEQYDPSTPGARWTQNALALSFINHLFSPANWIVNSMQTGTVTMPYLSSRYGLVRSNFALANAYRKLKAPKLGKSIESLRDRLTKKGMTTELSVIDHLMELGLIDRDAGMELEAGNVRRGMIERGLSRTASVASIVPKAIEAMNRSAAALAAYDLAIQNGKTHEQALRAAEDTVNDTHGDYANAVAPELFKKNVAAKLALQFKKYSQMMYRLISRDARIAIKPAPGESRGQAVSELMLLMATHATVAGAAGVPFAEGLKLLATLAASLGLDDDDWEDWQNKAQAALKSAIGGTASEAVMRGLPRTLGVDLSSRMGLDSLATFGAPRKNKDTGKIDLDAIKQWLFDSLAGAPIGVGLNTFQAIADTIGGDYRKALEHAPLPKFVTDSSKAIWGAAEPKKKASGIDIEGTQLNTREAIWKALGFAPASQQEKFEPGGSGYEAKQKRRTLRDRLAMEQDWLNADTGAERKAAWDEIREWNKEHKGKERITMDQLQKARTKRQRAKAKAD